VADADAALSAGGREAPASLLRAERFLCGGTAAENSIGLPAWLAERSAPGFGRNQPDDEQ